MGSGKFAGIAFRPRSFPVRCTVGIILVCLSGCFCRPPAESNTPAGSVGQTPAAASPNTTAVPTPASGQTSPQIIADILVVSLDNTPLKGMIPIVTERPNAFDPPPYRGDPTDERGYTRFTFPADRRWCLRAWDPELKWFANNFLEVAPSDEDAGLDGTIVMAPSSAAACLITDASGTPLANRPVELMLIHPKQGPWWPSRQTTSAEGTVLFSQLPPGHFDLEFRIDGTSRRLPDVPLPPGGALNLGAVAF